MEWLVQIAPDDELDTYNDASSLNIILVQDVATVYWYFRYRTNADYQSSSDGSFHGILIRWVISVRSPE